MTKDMEIAIKIPADLVEQIERLFDSVALQATEWVPRDRSYEAFLFRAIETEIWDLQDYEADLTGNSSAFYQGRDSQGKCSPQEQ